MEKFKAYLTVDDWKTTDLLPHGWFYWQKRTELEGKERDADGEREFADIQVELRQFGCPQMRKKDEETKYVCSRITSGGKFSEINPNGHICNTKYIF